MPDPRDIYLVKIYYKGQTGTFKTRPVLLINNLANDWVTIAEITSVPPKLPPSYYDKFKEPIINWIDCGLTSPHILNARISTI